MIYQNTNNVYLSDDLERRLIQLALEEQQRLRPLIAFRNWVKGLFA